MVMKVYIGNLAFSVDNEGLRALFSKFESITEVTIINDKFSGRSKGFGFITFSDDEEARTAISEMNGKEIEGRALRVNEARPLEERPRRSFKRY